jgi:hypothetical protein
VKPLTISSDTQMPPGGWKFTVPQTKVTLRANYAGTLHGRVNAHLLANGHPVIGRAEFEDACCRESGHGEPWCTGVKNPRPVTTLAKVKSFLKTMKVVVQERKFVDADERERRLTICRACPLLTTEGLGCHNCVDDLRAVEKEVGPLPPGAVDTCAACGCLVVLKTAIANESLDRAEAGESVPYDPGCWRLGH